MEILNKQVLNFLESNRVGVLAVQLKDGSPHSATVHFSYQKSPTRLFFLTDRNYKKCEALLDGSTVRGSFVTGFSEEEMKTLQLDGTVRIVSDTEQLAAIKDIHFKKISTAKEWEDDPDSVFLELIPTWWQYSDYNTDPEMRISSEK